MLISPQLLAELESTEGTVTRKLDESRAKVMDIEKYVMAEKDMRWMHNEDPMAVEKLAEGIRNFTKDLYKLEGYVHERLMGG